MSAIPEGSNVFIIDLKYITTFDKIDPLIDGHMSFLEKHYASGTFLVSGAKVPREGGAIIAVSDCKTKIQEIIKEDPFMIHNVAEYSITEIKPGMMNELLR